MKTISDIRLYKSSVENTDGNPLPTEFADKELNAVITRIVMKLREDKFSLGDFDHLYINFTTCFIEGGSAPSKRRKDRYHSCLSEAITQGENMLMKFKEKVTIKPRKNVYSKTLELVPISFEL